MYRTNNAKTDSGKDTRRIRCSRSIQKMYATLKKHKFNILYNDQQMHNYFTNYHTATCFDTIVSSSDSL